MEETKIEPALTPEEWNENREWPGPSHLAFVKRIGQVGPWTMEEIPPSVGGVEDGGDVRIGTDEEGITLYLDRDDRHAVAAACLNGQPFGFSWEDVDALTEAIMHLNTPEIERDAHDPEECAFLLQEVADRLAALLPPREQEDP